MKKFYNIRQSPGCRATEYGSRFEILELDTIDIEDIQIFC